MKSEADRCDILKRDGNSYFTISKNSRIKEVNIINHSVAFSA